MEIHNDGIQVRVTDASHEKYVDAILRQLTETARDRNAGIACRTPEYIATKIKERKAVIALYNDEFAGFCYIECWENKHYVANSGLIVVPKFRGRHVATRINRLAFHLCRLRWPEAKLYSLTSSRAVLHINASLGYVPVPFSEFPQDTVFWKSCGTLEEPCCPNCDVLLQSHHRYCVCTGMMYDPARHPHEPLLTELPQELIEFVQKAEENK